MATKASIGLGTAGIAGAVAIIAGPAFAIDSVQEDVTVGTSFTRQPSEVFCVDTGGCDDIVWTHSFNSACSKTADVRLRYQRDAQPDLTQKEDANFSGCTAKSWTQGSEFWHGHHQDAKVTSGSASMHFGAK